jgi:excisionase family DNA binding protein
MADENGETNDMTIPFPARLSCTIAEACEATGLGRTKLYEEMGAGRIKTTMIGKRRLILVSSLVCLIDPDGDAEPTAPEAA